MVEVSMCQWLGVNDPFVGPHLSTLVILYEEKKEQQPFLIVYNKFDQVTSMILVETMQVWN